ncbi:MAG: hypothetical protein MJ115_06130 [Clostridia bacterium]|nr:hypothetical protein [Clostridia bacterium]
MKKSKFYKIYFSVIVIFLVALIAGLIILFTWLKSYEQSQPSTIVNSVITDYLDKGKFINLKKDLDLEVSEYENDATLESALSAAIKDKKLTFSHSSLKPEGVDAAFIIKADDSKILNVYLKKHKIGKGYDIAYVELAKGVMKTVNIVMPKGTDITINGIPLADDLREDSEFPSLPSTIDVKTLTPTQTAKITGLLSETPEIKATENGKEVEVINEGTTYTVAQTIDKAVGDKVQQTAQAAAEAYAAYMQKDGSFGAFAQYCDSSTPFYKNVASSLVQFVKNHNGFKNENMSVTSLTKYSDTLYSCRVSFKHILLLSNSTYSDNFDKIVFVTKNKDTYKVIDMQNPVSSTEG